MSEKTSSTTSPSAPQRWLKRLLVSAGILTLVSLMGLAITFWPQSVTTFTDADTIKESQHSAAIRDILWQPPKPLADLLDEAGDMYEPRLSFDGQSLFFVRGKAGNNTDIYVASKTLNGWGEPLALLEINTEEDELGPEPTADGELLYFYSNRAGGLGGYDLWVSQRIISDGQTTFSQPANLGPATNSPFNDYGPALSPDGGTLYFSSNRPLPADMNQPNPNAWPGTLREDLYHRTYDLYHAPVSQAGIGQALPLMVLNTPFNEGTPAVSTVGDFLYFSSDRPDGEGGFDLYRSRRLRGAHQTVESLGQAVNSSANELDPALAMGGFELYFSSDRPQENFSPQEPNPYYLYRTASREVFRSVDTFQPTMKWGALWGKVGPNLLWGLLALLLMLLVASLMRDMHSRKLSLLARCLLVSLFAHFLLMLLFNVWEVGSSLAREFGRKGPIQVAIASPTIGQAIASQVRGEFASIEHPQTPQLIVEHKITPLSITPMMELTNIKVSRGEVKDKQMIAQQSHLPDTLPISETPKPIITQTQIVDAHTEVLDVAIPNEMPRESSRENHSLTLPVPFMMENIDHASINKPTFDATNISQSVFMQPTAMDLQKLTKPIPTETNTVTPVQSMSIGQFDIQKNESSTGMKLPSLPLDISISTSMETQRTSHAESLAMTEPSTKLDAVRGVYNVASDSSNHLADMAIVDPSIMKLPTPSYTSVLPTISPRMNTLNMNHAMAPPMMATQSLPTLSLPDLTLPKVEESNGVNNNNEALVYARLQDVDSTRATYHFSSGNDVATSIQIDPTRGSQDSPLNSLSGTPIATIEIKEAFTQDNSMASNILRSDYKPHLDRPLLDLRLPIETEMAVENENFAQRSDQHRQQLLEHRGGTDETEAAVARALTWLAAHQSEDGHWDGDKYDEGCDACDGRTDAVVDAAITSLSLLSFLAANHTHIKPGPYQKTVDRALNWLMKQQQSNGDLRGDETMYTHGMATIALSEAYGMTGDSRLEMPVRKAVRFIDRSRNRQDGGWRYDPGQPGDTSVLGWQVMALHSAQMAGVEIPLRSINTARKWMKKVSIPSKPGQYAYQPGRQATKAMAAEGMFIQQILGHQANEPMMRASARYISKFPPDWEVEANTYFWYYATLALYQHEGPLWDQWNEVLTRTLVTNQRRDGRAAGSWNPIGEWAQTGGRVCQTAMCALMLEVYYRYLPLYANQQSIEAIGDVIGTVTNAATGEPLTGVTITLDIAERPSLTTTTNHMGKYTLAIPEMPDFFAMSASHEGFIPASANMSSAKIASGSVRLNFDLLPQRYDIVAIESVPQVHHLGDDNFDGRINSQFQKQSEGDHFHIEFTISAAHHLERAQTAQIYLLAKGVQENHRLLFNNNELPHSLNQAPSDGSFGEFSARFNPDILRIGSNSFDIFAGRRGSDVDDFEFINVQIHFITSVED